MCENNKLRFRKLGVDWILNISMASDMHVSTWNDGILMETDSYAHDERGQCDTTKHGFRTNTIHTTKKNGFRMISHGMIHGACSMLYLSPPLVLQQGNLDCSNRRSSFCQKTAKYSGATFQFAISCRSS